MAAGTGFQQLLELELPSLLEWVLMTSQFTKLRTSRGRDTNRNALTHDYYEENGGKW